MLSQSTPLTVLLLVVLVVAAAAATVRVATYCEYVGFFNRMLISHLPSKKPPSAIVLVA